MPGMDEFVRSPLVGNVSERYGLGSELLFVSLIEALQQEGYVILSADTDGTIENVLLPATTGLSADDEATLFTGSRACGDDEAKIEAWLGLRTAYARHLAGRAVETIAEFARRDRVRDIDGLLTQVLDGVNEALDLLEGADEDEGPAEVDAPPFTFEEVVEIWDKAKAGA